MTLVIHAPNVHLGGGRTLLLALLESLSQPAVVQLDARLWPLPQLNHQVRIIRVAPRLIDRLRAERRLQSLCASDDTLLCFGNLPPLFSSAAKVSVYLQNRYLLGRRSLEGLPWVVRLRIVVERFWLRYGLRGAALLVQSETMKDEAKTVLGCNAVVMPFLPIEKSFPPERLERLYDYVYVASGEPHKNHCRLLQAWVILAANGYRPSLCLTLDQGRDKVLYDSVRRLVDEHDLNVDNVSPGQRDIFTLYRQSGALIYPSLFESFGLPLFEARRAELPIVASERDYVRDVVAPEVSFDPESALSIARAVMRHQNWDTTPLWPDGPAGFLDRLSGSA